MGRWTDMDSDSERLPEGFERVGYDADTQTYTYRDAEGTIYTGETGNRYGDLWPESMPSQRSTDLEAIERRDKAMDTDVKQSARMMLPFALLVLVVLLLLFRFLAYPGGDGGVGEVLRCGQGAYSMVTRKGDTCWAIAKKNGVSVKELLALEGNGGIVCERLLPGQGICVPM